MQTVYFLLVGIAIVSAQQARGSVEAEYLLQAGRVGRLEVGQPVDEIYQQFGRERIRLVETFPEGMFSPVLEIKLFTADPGAALVVPIREWPCPVFSASAIHVLDRRFRTADGLGIGSTLGDVRKRYPKVDIGRGEGRRVAVAREAGLTFVLEELEPLTDAAFVTSVYVFGDVQAVRAKRCPGRLVEEP